MIASTTAGERKALDTIHSWLVCASIASPEDMAQSFVEMERIAREALAAPAPSPASAPVGDALLHARALIADPPEDGRVWFSVRGLQQLIDEATFAAAPAPSVASTTAGDAHVSKLDADYWLASRTQIIDALERFGFQLMSNREGFWISPLRSSLAAPAPSGQAETDDAQFMASLVEKVRARGEAQYLPAIKAIRERFGNNTERGSLWGAKDALDKALAAPGQAVAPSDVYTQEMLDDAKKEADYMAKHLRVIDAPVESAPQPVGYIHPKQIEQLRSGECGEWCSLMRDDADDLVPLFAASPSPAVSADERARFEDWWTDGHVVTIPTEADGSTWTAFDCMWRGWQARAALNAKGA